MMVVGVRQIGKTYTIDKFSRKNFNNYIYVNLLDRKDIVELYKENISTSDKINKLEWLLGSKLEGDDTILFVDEVQESEEFISSLKYMCESNTKYNVIVAGSLLGVKINRFNSSFPVGKIYIEYMYPMDFPEFLSAIGKEDIIKDIKYCYTNNSKMEDAIHLKLLELYRLYLCVGKPKEFRGYRSVHLPIAQIIETKYNECKELYLLAKILNAKTLKEVKEICSEEEGKYMEVYDKIEKLVRDPILLGYYDYEEAQEQEKEWLIEEARDEGMLDGLQRGLERGRTEGIEKERKQIIENMMANGIEIPEISKMINIPEEEIHKLID